ncbi:MAG: hypothetical protein A2V77_23675 [Anaeromyxobacter sp. RBG_16_69_14]|nr:MAG: hypothetical protein A2V77_23675 [Anaeromyxobacter sp. RBG_16_69_14]
MLRSPLALALLTVSLPACPDSPRGLTVDVPVTAGVAGGALAVWGVTELAKGELTPGTCRWCGPPSVDRDVWAGLVWSDPKAAGLLSDVLVLALPASLAGADFFFAGRDARRATEDVLVSMEAVALAAVATQVVKFTVARRRPAAWAAGLRTSPDDDRAFFSGHVATAFAAAGAFGTVARLRGYPAWPAVYAVGFGTAAAIGYLRMAADEHWLSDVVAAAAVGAGLGVAVPLFFHRGGHEEELTFTPLSGGVVGLRVSGSL